MCTERAYRNVFARFLSHCLPSPRRGLLHARHTVSPWYLSPHIISSDGRLIEPLRASLHSSANQQKASDKIVRKGKKKKKKLYPNLKAGALHLRRLLEIRGLILFMSGAPADVGPYKGVIYKTNEKSKQFVDVGGVFHEGPSAGRKRNRRASPASRSELKLLLY